MIKQPFSIICHPEFITKKNNMKNTFIAAIVMICLFGNVDAQRITRAVDVGDILTLNNLAARVINLIVVDSIGQTEAGQARGYNTPVVHMASFEIELGRTDAINITKALYSSINGQPLQSLTVSKLNLQGQGTEERIFGTVTVKEIAFAELNAESREPAKVKITIQADDVQYNDQGGQGWAESVKGNRVASAGRFSMVMGNLPTQGVMRIGNLKIVASSRSQPVRFSVDIPSADAGPWYHWFNTGGGGNENKEATITLVESDQSRVILSFELSQVEIVSSSVASTPGRISKTTIGLRTSHAPVIN